MYDEHGTFLNEGGGGGSDPIYNYFIVKKDNETLLQIQQYIYASSHSDYIGIAETLLSIMDGEFKMREQHFRVFPRAGSLRLSQ
jgi:hypothetical protein